MFILINNQLLNTANAKIIDTYYYITISCLIKTGTLKAYGIGFFLRRLGKFSFFSKTTQPILKRVVRMEIPVTPLCAFILPYPLLLPYPTFYSLQKMCGVNFLPQFSDFIHFLKNYSRKSAILGSMVRKGCWKLSCIRGYAQIFFFTKSYGTQNS